MIYIFNMLRANKATLFVFIAAIALFSQPPFGNGILLIAYPILLYQGIQLIRFWRLPEKRANKLTVMLIAILSVLLVKGIHSYREHSRRDIADQIVKVIENFKLNNNRYPNSLAEANVEKMLLDHVILPIKLSGEWKNKETDRWIYYSLREGRPDLTYDASFEIFDYWWFNFKSHNWQYTSP